MKAVYVVMMWNTQTAFDDPSDHQLKVNVELFNSKDRADLRASEYTREDQDSCYHASVTLIGIQ